MGISLFVNFDPDELQSGFDAATPFGYAPFLFILITNLLDVCAKWTKLGDFLTRTRLTNSGFFSLSSEVENLAQVGFEKREFLVWYDDISSYKFADLEVDVWARHGFEYVEEAKTSHSQILGLSALLIIDAALSMAKEEGISLDFVESLAKAGVFMALAKDAESLQAIKISNVSAYACFEAEERRKKSQYGKKRHAPLNVARTFTIREWEKNKKDYEFNKTAFARHYVRIISNQFSLPDGTPISVTEKTIRESWLSDTGLVASVPVS